MDGKMAVSHAGLTKADVFHYYETNLRYPILIVRSCTSACIQTQSEMFYLYIKEKRPHGFFWEYIINFIFRLVNYFVKVIAVESHSKLKGRGT